MLALCFLAEIVTRSPPNSAAKAVVRIERSIQAHADDWSRKSDVQRREVRRIDERGRPVLLRIVEHQ